MERKNKKLVIDKGFGFPIHLINVPMTKIRGEWVPDIDFKKLEHATIVMLSQKPNRLTGNEVRFVRLHFQMTLQEFGGRFDVTHVAVKKWENCANKVTSMNWSTEKDIRLFILSKYRVKKTDFFDVYSDLETKKPGHTTPVELDIRKLRAS